MDHLDRLEARSIHIIREAYNSFKNLCMLWSIGKDSTVLLCLARKVFYGHVPFPLVHIDTHYKIPQMIEYRDRLAIEWNLDMIYGENRKALEEKRTFRDGNCTRLECCRNLKTEALAHTLSGDWPRYRMDHDLKKYVIDKNTEPYTGVIVGVRADEEGSRSKEDISRLVILTMTGTFQISLLNSGDSIKRILLLVPIYVFILCLTGQN